jgi:tetratricopeptide (TPR) repeat protein
MQDDALTLLAHHYRLAEAWGQAFHYHIAAGVQAQNRFANRSALSLFASALDIVQHVVAPDTSSDTTDTTVQVIEIYARSGDIHTLLGELEQAQAAYLHGLHMLNEWRKQQGLWRKEHGPPLKLPMPFAQINVRLHRLLASIEELRSNYESAFDWLRRGIAWSTEETRDEQARSYLLGTRIYYRQGELTRGIEWVKQSLSLAETLDDKVIQAEALRMMGALLADQGESAESIVVLQQAHLLWNEIDDVNGLNKILNDMGTVYNDMSQLQEAITCYEQSLQISEAIDDAHAIASTSNNLAVVLVKRGALQRANELYEYSRAQYQRIGSLWGIALSTGNRGEVLLLQGTHQEALQLFEESIALMEHINVRNDMPEVLRLAAATTLAMSNYEQAISYADRSLEIASDLGMTLEAAIAQRTLGEIALQRGDLAAAAEHLEQSRVTLEQSDNRYELGKVLLWQARLAHKTGQHQRIIQALQQAQHIFRELDAQPDLLEIEALALDYGVASAVISREA